MTNRTPRVSVLSTVDTDRALAMIETVSRRSTPITITRTRRLDPPAVERLRRELVDLLCRAHEPGVSAYLRPAGDRRWAYGFFRYPWALRALHFLDVEGGAMTLGPVHAEWVQGLLFGYDAAAIARLLQAGRPAPATGGPRSAGRREALGGTPSALNRIDGILASRAPHGPTGCRARRRSSTRRSRAPRVVRPES